MAKILKSNQREFQESPNKIDKFRIFTDISRAKNGINPQNLNFDLRQLNPGQYSAPYHFHRYSEELFMIISGSATLRTPDGFDVCEYHDSNKLLIAPAYEIFDKDSQVSYFHGEENIDQKWKQE